MIGYPGEINKMKKFDKFVEVRFASSAECPILNSYGIEWNDGTITFPSVDKVQGLTLSFDEIDAVVRAFEELKTGLQSIQMDLAQTEELEIGTGEKCNQLIIERDAMKRFIEVFDKWYASEDGDEKGAAFPDVLEMRRRVDV
jgi:hypothetical protein